LSINQEIVNPNISNFIKSLRDIGYSFEIAVADLIDNSISAKATTINIYSIDNVFCLLDNGEGMDELELRESMRLATKDPEDDRPKNDLGRFGLGLKTASFSQCKKLTVISKKNSEINARQWDLDHISKINKWALITPRNTNELPLYEELENLDSGTLVVWQEFDGNTSNSENLDALRKHISLVFHRFLEGADSFKRLNISINNNPVKPFNPFNVSHAATQEISVEKIKIGKNTIEITPYILPHHSKLSTQEYEQYATEDGYIKSQGFYLYREHRILIYGTWWGLHRATDAHKLVRIKIDIPNTMDKQWGIDIKKSSARPSSNIKKELKKIIRLTTKKGSKPFTGRGRKIQDKSMDRFWDIKPISEEGEFRFSINKEHPLYIELCNKVKDNNIELINLFLNGLEAYLPLEAIQAKLQTDPKRIKQESALAEKDILDLANTLKIAGLSESEIDKWLKTEVFSNHKNIFD
jgi:hypothetical protein